MSWDLDRCRVSTVRKTITAPQEYKDEPRYRIHHSDTEWRCYEVFPNLTMVNVNVKWDQRIKDPSQCYLGYVSVHPEEAQGKGLGTEALWRTFIEMQKAGCKQVKGKSLEGAKGYWKSLDLPLAPSGGEQVWWLDQ